MKSGVRCIRVCFSVCGILCMSQYTVTEPSRVYVRRVCAVPLLILVYVFAIFNGSAGAGTGTSPEGFFIQTFIHTPGHFFYSHSAAHHSKC